LPTAEKLAIKDIVSLELLHQSLTDAGASLSQARGAAQLAQVLSQSASSSLTLEDHPWLQAAAAYFPDHTAHGMQVMLPPGLPNLKSVPTLVSVGLGAVPETGSILLGNSSPQAFRLSLCPRRHLVVIPADQANLTLASALTLTAREPSGLVSWVTGPSRTADIEKVLVLGAQGASELMVILYQDD
jgi:L-lactate utilization protein LutC